MKLGGVSRSTSPPSTVGQYYTITEVTCDTDYTIRTKNNITRYPMGIDADYLTRTEAHATFRFWLKVDGNGHTLEYETGDMTPISVSSTFQNY